MKREVKQLLLGSLLLIVGCALVWFQTRGFDYVRLDDNSYTFDFAPVAAGLGWANLKAVFCDFTQGGIWMPLTSLTYMVDISLFGGGPSVHHLTNVAGHTVNAILFFGLLLRLSRNWEQDPASSRRFVVCLCAALIWALHPLRNESVAWIASRKDVVFTLFTLVGLHLWLTAGWVATTLATVSCLCACLSKPTGMVFPFLAWIVARLAGRPAKRNGLRYLLPLLMAVATGLLATYSQTHATGADADVRGLYEGYGSLPWRCLNAAVATGLYLAQTAVPWGAHVLYRPVVGGLPHGTVLGLAVLLLVAAPLAWTLFSRRFAARRPVTLYLLAGWFVVSVGPTLGVFGAFGNHARADRFLYVPAMAFSLLLAWGVLKANLKARLVAALLVPCVLAYGAVAWANARRFENDFTLFTHVLELDPDHPLALAHVGAEFCARFNDPDDGIACFRRSLELDPTQEDVAAQLVYALAVRGDRADHEEIRTHCAALLENPSLDNKGMATEALGMIAMREMRWDDAIRFFTVAATAEKRRDAPDVPLVQLAMCHFNKGQVADAKRLFERLARNSENRAVRQRAIQALQRIWQLEHPTN